MGRGVGGVCRRGVSGRSSRRLGVGRALPYTIIIDVDS